MPGSGVVVTCGAAWVPGAPFPFHREPRAGGELDPAQRRRCSLSSRSDVSLALLARFRPIPAWDGWMNWSIKAKALAFDGHFYGPVFKASVFNYSHQDYPPLLPAWQALAYVISGQPTVSWPLQFQLAWFWTAGAVALVSLASRHWGGASLFMLAWVCAPQVLYWTMAGYADVPLAFFLVAGVAVLLLSTIQSPAVAGLLLGACALSKNEGLPVAVMAALSVAAVRCQSESAASGAGDPPRHSVSLVHFHQFHRHVQRCSQRSKPSTGEVPHAHTAHHPDRRGVDVAGVLRQTLGTAWIRGRCRVGVSVETSEGSRRRASRVDRRPDVRVHRHSARLERHLATSLERVAIAPMGLLALSLVTAIVPGPGLVVTA